MIKSLRGTLVVCLHIFLACIRKLCKNITLNINSSHECQTRHAFMKVWQNNHSRSVFFNQWETQVVSEVVFCGTCRTAGHLSPDSETWNTVQQRAVGSSAQQTELQSMLIHSQKTPPFHLEPFY